MSLKFLHQVIIAAAFGISLFFAWWCFTDPSVADSRGYFIAGIVSVGCAIGFVFYEIYFLKKTRRLILH